MYPNKHLIPRVVQFITLLHLSCCVHHEQNSCVTEHSTAQVNENNYTIVWKSKSKFRHSVTLSDPPCLDESKNLIFRTCVDGRWTSQTPICHYIEENSLCPPDFIQNDHLCVFVTEPQEWDRNCPYHGASAEIKDVSKLIWYPVKRKTPYGPYEFALPGEHYGLDFFDEHPLVIAGEAEDSDENDCVIKSASGAEFTSCDSLHPHICSYKYNYFGYRCPKGCVPGGLGSNYCYCKVLDRTHKNLPRNQWCGGKPLASPKYSYERSILHRLSGDDACWIENPEVPVDSYEFLAISKHGWSFHQNGELSCAICQIPANLYHKIDMMLKFNTQSGKLYLNVYSPESIYRGGDDDSVFCFTDATDKLKKRVEIEEIWDSVSDAHSGRQLKVFRVSISEDGPGYYWCETFQLPEVGLIKSNKVVAHKHLKGHEYSLRVVIHKLCRFSLTACKNPSVAFISTLSKNLFRNGFFAKFIKKVRLFHIYNIDKSNARTDVLLHLTAAQTRLPFLAEYLALSRHLVTWLRLKQTTMVFFRSSEACFPEITLTGTMTLNWQLSAIGTIRTPDQVCVQQNGAPVRRQCQGDFQFGSQWGTIEGNCSKNIKLSSKTEFLHSLVSSNLSEDLAKNIAVATENSTDLTVLDLHYVAEVLSKAAVLNQNFSKEFVDEVGQIIDNLMRSNTSIMKESQILLNATDEILDSFENMLSSANETNDDVFLLQKGNLVIHITKPFLNNISGLALYGENDASFLEFNAKNLYSNTSLDDLLDDDNLEVAVYVPQKLLDLISLNLTFDAQSSITIITTIFHSDTFFNSDLNETNTVGSRIVSVTIPDYGEFLPTTLPVIFKPQNHHSNQDCAFWNYGISSETHSGHWSTLGGDYLGKLNNTSLEICAFSHLTNFALLVMSEEISALDDEGISYNLTIEDSNDKILTVISDVGCSLSVLGICGIFITSLVFQSWREKVGTKILIQLCITIFLQIIFFNIANVRTSATKLSLSFCTTVGIILHYVIISEFSWMLVAAILQFFRFVKVIGPVPNRIILKAMILGWGLPIVPIILVCAIDYQNYSAGIQGFCYPKGLGLYLGVLFPIALIVTANMAIFVCVIRNVFGLSVETPGTSQKILKRQICLTVLLFFLLGLPWIFGLVAELIDHDSVLSYILIYLFCFTATLQGFVLFIFYVILDKSTRTLWYRLIKRLMCNKTHC